MAPILAHSLLFNPTAGGALIMSRDPYRRRPMSEAVLGMSVDMRRPEAPEISGEQWRPVEQMSGRYEVSDHGRVRSLCFHGKPRLEPKLLRQTHNEDGYIKVSFYVDGRVRAVPVHRLVLLAFVGPAPESHVCGHRDGDRANNHIDNLRWVTYQTNNGTDKRAHGKALHKMTAETLRQVPSLRAAGMTQQGIADMFGVTQSYISRVLSGRRSWGLS